MDTCGVKQRVTVKNEGLITTKHNSNMDVSYFVVDNKIKMTIAPSSGNEGIVTRQLNPAKFSSEECPLL